MSSFEFLSVPPVSQFSSVYRNSRGRWEVQWYLWGGAPPHFSIRSFRRLLSVHDGAANDSAAR